MRTWGVPSGDCAACDHRAGAHGLALTFCSVTTCTCLEYVEQVRAPVQDYDAALADARLEKTPSPAQVEGQGRGGAGGTGGGGALARVSSAKTGEHSRSDVASHDAQRHPPCACGHSIHVHAALGGCVGSGDGACWCEGYRADRLTPDERDAVEDWRENGFGEAAARLLAIIDRLAPLGGDR